MHSLVPDGRPVREVYPLGCFLRITPLVVLEISSTFADSWAIYLNLAPNRADNLGIHGHGSGPTLAVREGHLGS